MKNYLSFGGGVNSVAMMLLILTEDWYRTDFEAVFVDTGCEYPETHEYLEMFNKYLVESQAGVKVTILSARKGFRKTETVGLYEYCLYRKMVPAIYPRWCTVEFKLKPLFDYYKKPCFQMIGIDNGESKRAKISVENGVENRYPLIEWEMDRQDCKDFIKSFDLPLPIKSGCYICPFQNLSRWKDLRVNHPELFCRAEQLEKQNIEYRKSKGKTPMYLSPRKASLRSIVEEDQYKLFKQDEYPPCNCML